MNEVRASDPSDSQTEADTQPLSWRERMQWEAAQLMANPRETMRAWAQTAGRNTLNVANTASHRLGDVSRALRNPPEPPPTLNTPIAERPYLPGEVDMSTAQATVEGYIEVVTDLQQRQARLTANDFEAAKAEASRAQAPLNVARRLVNIAREEETIVAHAGGYILGLHGEPTLQSVTDAYGRVIRLDELGASMQAQEAQGRLEMQARAALIGRTEAAMSAKLSQLYQEQAGRGVANPIVPDLPHDAAVNIVNELWTRAMPSVETNSTGGNQTIDAAGQNTQNVSREDVVSQAEVSETPTSPVPHDEPQETGGPASQPTQENPPQISTATWVETHFSDLGLTLTHEEAVQMVLDAEHHRRQYERACAHVNERYEAGDHTPITAIVRGRIDEALTNIPNLADVRLLGDSVDAVAHALQNLQNADPQIRARVGTIFLTRIREMQQNMPASNVSAIGDADPRQNFVSAVIAQMEIYSQEESDVNRVHGAIGEIHRLCQEYVVVDESIGLQEGQNHFESTIYITLPLEDTTLETNFFVGRHTYLQVGDQIARVATGNDGNNEPIIRLYFDHFQEGRDSSFSLRELVENQSSGTTSPISIDSTHTYSWHIERDGGVATTTDQAGKQTTNITVRIVCDVTESSADHPEDLTELHDSVISGPSSETDAPLGTHFGEQEDDRPGEPPATPHEEDIPHEAPITIELTHPGFERLEHPHSYAGEAHEGQLIEKWEEEAQVTEGAAKWGIHPVTDQIMPRMWVYDVGVGGDAQGEVLNVDGKTNVHEHGDFALVAIAQPSGNEPNRTWTIRAELLHKIPPPPDIATRINNINERLRLLNDTPPEQMDVASLTSTQIECDAILEQYEAHVDDGNIDATQIEHIRSLSSLIGKYIRTLQEKELSQPIKLDADKLAHMHNLDAAMQNASHFSPNLVAAGNAERAGNIDEALNYYRQELALMRLQNDEQRSSGQPPVPGQEERMDIAERGVRRILEPRRDAQILVLHAETERLSTGFQEAYTRDPTSAIDTFMRDVNSNIIPAIHAIHQIDTELRDAHFSRLNIELSHLFDGVNTILVQNHNPRVLELIDLVIGLLRELRHDTIQPAEIDQIIGEREAYRLNAEELLTPFDSEHVEDNGVKFALTQVEELKNQKDTREYTHALERLAVSLEATGSRNDKMRAYVIYGDLATTYKKLEDAGSALRYFEARNRLETELFNRVAVTEEDGRRNPIVVEPPIEEQGEHIAQFKQRLDEFITHVPGPLQQPTRRLYEIAWDGLHAELAVVRRVGELAEDSHIPFLGPAFAGFAEFIQGTFTLRSLETGLMTDDTRAEARRHFVNWITSSIEGGIDLAEFVTGGGPEIEVIRSILLNGNGQRELIPRLISSVICQRLVEASQGSGSEIIGTIGQIAVGLLGDNGIASGVDAALLADPNFTQFIDNLSAHFRQHPH